MDLGNLKDVSKFLAHLYSKIKNILFYTHFALPTAYIIHDILFCNRGFPPGVNRLDTWCLHIYPFEVFLQADIHLHNPKCCLKL